MYEYGSAWAAAVGASWLYSVVWARCVVVEEYEYVGVVM